MIVLGRKLVSGYFLWWYGAGLTQSWQIILAILGKVADFFSLEILLKTWVAPWKNDVMTARNLSLGDQVKLWQMNMVSRLVGFFVRTVVILVCLFCIALATLASAFFFFGWLITPILVIALPLLGVRMLFQ